MGRIIIPNFTVGGKKYELEISGREISDDIVNSDKAREIQKLAGELFQSLLGKSPEVREKLRKNESIDLRLKSSQVEVLGLKDSPQRSRALNDLANRINKIVLSSHASIELRRGERPPLPTVELHLREKRARRQRRTPRKRLSSTEEKKSN